MAHYAKYQKKVFFGESGAGPPAFGEAKKDFEKLKEVLASVNFQSLFLDFRVNTKNYIYAALLAAIMLEGLYIWAGAKSLSGGNYFKLSHPPSHAAIVFLPKYITLVDKDTTTKHISLAKTPREFFQSEGVLVGEEDSAYPDLDRPFSGVIAEITIKRAKKVTIVDNNKEFLRIGAFNTIADLFSDSRDYADILKGRGVDTLKKVEDGDSLVLNTKIFQRGIASWYGPGFQGRTTASGEIYDMHKISAAHKTLPLGTTARVVNVANGKSVVLEINDRGPYVEPRIIDLSFAAKEKIGMRDLGYVWVEVLQYPEE